MEAFLTLEPILWKPSSIVDNRLTQCQYLEEFYSNSAAQEADLQNMVGDLFFAVPTRTKMGPPIFICPSQMEDLYRMKKWAIFPPLYWSFPLKQPVLPMVPICTSFFFCIQQNKTLSGNNWAGSERGRNFILGGLIPTSEALWWKHSGSIVGTWGPLCFMSSMCSEHLRLTEWGRARFYFIPAYSY